MDKPIYPNRTPSGWPAVSAGWLVAAVIMTLVIWGNSLVPGTGSSSLSLAVMEAVHGALAALGLPYGWVTNFVVRKCAHFTEYAVLGFLVARGWRAGRGMNAYAFSIMCATLFLVPAVDETIQLFVPGRAGMIADVALDCCGAAAGAAVAALDRTLRPRDAS